MAVTIAKVKRGTPAARLGLRGGDRLLAVDGHPLNDMLDYGFYTARSHFSLQAEMGGRQRTVQVQKGEDADFGCEFATYLIDRQHSCCNRCVFCFVDQMPPGMRPSLYFKDDDERLSFLYGNYITLTNLTRREAERIVEMHISPINISVHTTDGALRVRMMQNPRAGEVLEYLDLFAAGGIRMNFQIVLCPGWNDGAALEQTLEKLIAYGECTQSVAVVPVGLTRYREGLTPLTTYDAAGAQAVLQRLQRVGEDCLARFGRRMVYASDEFFLLAGQPMPPQEYYEDYPQLENGVGIQRLLQQEFAAALAASPVRRRRRTVDIAVGEAGYGLMCALAQACMEKNPAVQIVVHRVVNEFFGGCITVTGLVTGQDILRQLRGRLAGGQLLIPRVMLRAECDLFLDDLSLRALSAQLGVRLRVVGTGGDELLAAFLGRRPPRPLR